MAVGHRLSVDRAKDIGSLTSALEAQVKVMQIKLLSMRTDVSTLTARPLLLALNGPVSRALSSSRISSAD